jgi:hypothetical protein
MVTSFPMQGGFMKQVFFCLALVFLVATGSYAEESGATAVLLDVSRSLSPKEFEKIKAIIQKWIERDHSNAHFLYTFGSKVQRIESDQLKNIKSNESSTRFNDAAYDAMQDLKKENADKKALLIFSDGKDTSSATTVEDIITFAKSESIAINCVGIGKASTKSLERISKLTGGTYFVAKDPHLIDRINTAIDTQQTVSKPMTVEQPPVVSKPAPLPATHRKPAAVTAPAQEETESSSLTIVFVIAALAIAGIAAYVLIRRKNEARFCPTCNKQLESFQTICPDCPGQTRILAVPQFIQDTNQKPEKEAESESTSAPAEWYDLKQETQEIMMKTTYLAETPLLIVTKGTNLGESYKLSKEAPISIGRSRINEIRPFDGSISAQHCRIIPENGQHVLYDLGSTNGTLLNNQKVSKAILKEGDLIGVGETILQYKVEHTR